ncbi:unnamed protein product [Schistosoma mattheei]|uniref:Uncharacterized protein n=1 Tax=Schistosoma mattheei TaxID=31246 RepID=A0A183NEL8_9TREM|nr:unnamed protein product [Schistosoma mattheei]
MYHINLAFVQFLNGLNLFDIVQDLSVHAMLVKYQLSWAFLVLHPVLVYLPYQLDLQFHNHEHNVNQLVMQKVHSY